MSTNVQFANIILQYIISSYVGNMAKCPLFFHTGSRNPAEDPRKCSVNKLFGWEVFEEAASWNTTGKAIGPFQTGTF